MHRDTMDLDVKASSATYKRVRTTRCRLNNVSMAIVYATPRPMSTRVSANQAIQERFVTDQFASTTATTVADAMTVLASSTTSTSIRL